MNDAIQQRLTTVLVDCHRSSASQADRVPAPAIGPGHLVCEIERQPEQPSGQERSSLEGKAVESAEVPAWYGRRRASSNSCPRWALPASGAFASLSARYGMTLLVRRSKGRSVTLP